MREREREFISACTSVQSDQSSQDTLWVSKGPKRLQADSEDSNQTAGRTCNLVGNAVPRLL